MLTLHTYERLGGRCHKGLSRISLERFHLLFHAHVLNISLSERRFPPGCTRARAMIYSLVKRQLWSVAVLLAMQPAYAQTGAPTFPNPGKTSMSKDNQHAMGLEVAEQVFTEEPSGISVGIDSGLRSGNRSRS